MGNGSVASGVPAAAPPVLGNRKSWSRPGPPLTRMLPSGVSASAMGPMPTSLCPMPVTNAWAWKGDMTRLNSDGFVVWAGEGTAALATLNNGLVVGVLTGGGGWPKFGGVVEPTDGVLPRSGSEPSSGVTIPAGG